MHRCTRLRASKEWTWQHSCVQSSDGTHVDQCWSLSLDCQQIRHIILFRGTLWNVCHTSRRVCTSRLLHTRIQLVLASHCYNFRCMIFALLVCNIRRDPIPVQILTNCWRMLLHCYSPVCNTVYMSEQVRSSHAPCSPNASMEQRRCNLARRTNRSPELASQHNRLQFISGTEIHTIEKQWRRKKQKQKVTTRVDDDAHRYLVGFQNQNLYTRITLQRFPGHTCLNKAYAQQLLEASPPFSECQQIITSYYGSHEKSWKRSRRTLVWRPCRPRRCIALFPLSHPGSYLATECILSNVYAHAMERHLEADTSTKQY